MLIQQIRLRNFKAFKNDEVLDVDGKNVLICGNNGSGKSSLHYALHVFFQSSIKGESFKKYFTDPKDKSNGTESLLNIYGNPQDYLLEISVKKADASIQKYQIKPTLDIGALSHQHTDIQSSDFASDFISHRLLVNFYNFRNSQDANIWFLFEKEVFPYWNDDKRSQSFDTWLKEIQDDFRKLEQETEVVVADEIEVGETVAKQARRKRFNRSSTEYKALQGKITDFNKSFISFYNSIKEKINDILTEFLPDEKLEVALDYKTPLDTNTKYEWEWNRPELIIKVKRNGDEIAKPHVFLNEARLTALALAIRLAMFEQKFKGTGGDAIKLLVLDDLLISLDMSFRMKLVNYIQTQQKKGGSFEGYKIFILTHDKGLFEVLKRTLAKDVKEWKWFEFFESNKYPIENPDDYRNPIIIEDKTLLEIAQEYLTGATKTVNDKRVVVREKSYELCALFLRKRVEQILKRYYDPDLESIFRFRVLETLERGLAGVEKEWRQKQRLAFERLFDKELDIQKLIALKGLNLTPPTDGEGEPKKTHDANNFKNTLYTYLEQYHSDFETSQKNKQDMLSLSKALQEIRARILNVGAHPTDETIHELELRGAIEKIREFEKTVLGLKAN